PPKITHYGAFLTSAFCLNRSPQFIGRVGRDLGIERPDWRRRGLRNRAGALWVGPAFHPLVLWSAGLTVSICAPWKVAGRLNRPGSNRAGMTMQKRPGPAVPAIRRHRWWVIMKKQKRAKALFWHNIRNSLIILAVFVSTIVVSACSPFSSDSGSWGHRDAGLIQFLAELRNVQLCFWEDISIYNPSPRTKTSGRAWLVAENERLRYGQRQGHQLSFWADSANREVRQLVRPFKLSFVRLIRQFLEVKRTNGRNGWRCAAVFPNCLDPEECLYFRIATLITESRPEPFKCYKSPLDGYQSFSVNLIGVFQGEPLEERNDSVGKNDNECNGFNRFFPPKLALLSVITGIIALFWGWGNARCGLRLPWSVLCWISGAVLWAYGFGQIMLWIVRCH